MKNLFLFIIFITAFFIQQLNTAEKEKYTFLYNSKLDMYSGAENILSLYKLTGLYEDKLLEKVKWNENTVLNKIAGIGFRLAKVSFLDVPVGDWFMKIQDVYFGHGAKIREYNFAVEYKIRHPWNWYDWWFRINVQDFYYDATNTQREGIYAGGLEGRQVISQTARIKCLLEDNYKWYDISLIAGQFDNSLFIFWTPDPVKEPGVFYDPEYDSSVTSYITQMFYQYEDRYPSIVNDRDIIYSYTYNDMQKGAVWNLCDPLLLYTAIYGGYKYIVYDQKTFKNPMIKITDDVSFLPGTKYNLTPIGGDYYLYGYLKVFKKLFVAYYREGGDKYSKASGLGLSGNNIIDSNKISLNVGFDYWLQPDFSENAEFFFPDYKRGFNGEFMATYKLNDILSINYGFGYKDIGYLIGKPYNKGAYSYAGFTVSF